MSPIFKNVPLNERGDFLDKLVFRLKTYKKGERIADQGDIVDALYILIDGSVKTEMISEAGSILSIETIRALRPLAPAFLFAENNRFPVDVTALEDCEVMSIPKVEVMKLLSSNEAFLSGYMAFNSDRTQFLSERLKLFSIKTIKGKLAQYILERTKDGKFVIERTQTELAEYFGVARPSLSRSLSEMVHDNVIKLEKRSGEILNLNRLKELLIQ
jgi:cAMP-binding proteins - catabolite gene activator and regulatory subunit of cAMP-dependent protein kinases